MCPLGPCGSDVLTIAQIIKHVQNAHPKEWEVLRLQQLWRSFLDLLCLNWLASAWLDRRVHPSPAVSGFMTGSAINIAAVKFPD